MHCIPVGNAGNITAYWMGYQEYAADSVVTSTPRMFGFQAAGAAPIVRGAPVLHPTTIATAIRIGNPASWDRAVRAIRETRGVVIDLPDSEILDAKAVVDASGVGCEPASAASVAGVRALVAKGVIAQTDTVVAVLTGHILKDPGILLQYHRDADPPNVFSNRPIQIDAEISEVERVLTAARREDRL